MTMPNNRNRYLSEYLRQEINTLLLLIVNYTSKCQVYLVHNISYCNFNSVLIFKS